MKRERGVFLSLAFWVLIGWGMNATWADVPRIVKSIPADGAVNVSTQLEQIVILFDRNMKMNSYSVLLVGDQPFPPLLPDDEPWETPLRFVLKVRDLKPNIRYAIQLNGETKKGFQSAEDQIPLPPTVITFTTGDGTSATGQPFLPTPASPPATQPATQTDPVSGGSAGQPLVLHFDPPPSNVPSAGPSSGAPADRSWPVSPPSAAPAGAPVPAWNMAPGGELATDPNQILERMEATLARLRSITATIDSILSMGGQTMTTQGQYISDLSRNAFAMQSVARTPQGDMRSRMVCDGQTVWQETEMGGQRMVQKASLALMQQMNGGSSPNPIMGARQLRQQFDFHRASRGTARDGTAVHVLEGSYKPAYLQQVQQQLQTMEAQNPPMAAQMRQQLSLIKAIRFQVGVQDSLPRAQEMLDGQGQPVMGMYLSALSVNQHAASTLFQYTPPPGVMVMDMDQIGSGGRAAVAPPTAPAGFPPPGQIQGSVPASLVGTWLTRTPELEILAVLNSDGTFTRQLRTAEGSDFSQGRYQVSGDTLMVYPNQDEPVRFRYRLVDANTLEVVDENGEGVHMIRQGGTGAMPPAPPASSVPPSSVGEGLEGKVAVSGRRPTVVFQRQWERNERAFSLLVPQGWQMEGGIFNVNPLQMNGPGNSQAPKGDLTVRRDTTGSVMCRWLPNWNYADFSVDPPPAAGLFPVGSQYQGMQVKPMPTAEGFLQELFATLHPGATDIQLVARDDFPEIQQAYQQSFQSVNQMLAGLGKRPAQFNVLGLTVDYTEKGMRYREGLFTILVDMRSGAFLWYNDLTYVARAPAVEADVWRPVLETIRSSVRFNPDWLRAVRQAMGERAQTALETQRYINKVAQEIQENRTRTQTAINHENYLFLSGQEEFVNPYTREVERDTSYYKHHWVNPNGDYIYTDEDAFNPNQERTLNQVEWKTTPVQQR